MLDAMRATVLFLLLSAAPALAQQAQSDTLFSSAMQAQKRGDDQTAILDYEKLLKLQPNLIEARANLGAALAHAGRFDEAIVQYRLALVAAPDNTQIRMNVGLAYYKKGDLENARREFTEVRKTRPADPQLAILLGDSEVRLGQAADAAAMLTPMEADNAANPDFEYVLGTALIQSGSKREGAARLEKVAASTSSADAYMLAGSALMDVNDYEHGRADLEAALRLNPNLPRIHALTGMARDQTGDATDAEPAFREELRRNADDFDSNLYLGAILYKRREMDEAKKYLDRALQLNPSSSMAQYEAAMWKSTAGQFADAAKDLEALVKANPDWLQPHIELASVYYRLHRPADGAKERAIVAKLSAQQQSEGPPKP
jgi:tetratricopeptide (TPR) repeat protein